VIKTVLSVLRVVGIIDTPSRICIQMYLSYGASRHMYIGSFSNHHHTVSDRYNPATGVSDEDRKTTPREFCRSGSRRGGRPAGSNILAKFSRNYFFRKIRSISFATTCMQETSEVERRSRNHRLLRTHCCMCWSVGDTRTRSSYFLIPRLCDPPCRV
jgi:hypothetical protein